MSAPEDTVDRLYTIRLRLRAKREECHAQQTPESMERAAAFNEALAIVEVEMARVLDGVDS